MERRPSLNAVPGKMLQGLVRKNSARGGRRELLGTYTSALKADQTFLPAVARKFLFKATDEQSRSDLA